jgi:hypothetical protein
MGWQGIQCLDKPRAALMLAKLIAVAIHEVRAELHKLDPPATAPQADEMPRYDVSSTTAASTERASSWDHDTRPPVRASFGFGPLRVRQER